MEYMKSKYYRHPAMRVREAKRVFFFRNGDPHFKQLSQAVNHRAFPTWPSLLSHLGEKIPLPNGVRHIYTVEGKEILDLEDFENGKAYVCASGVFQEGVEYGKEKSSWKESKPIQGKRKEDKTLFEENRDIPMLPSLWASNTDADDELSPISKPGRPRVITLVSNTHRSSRGKVLLNSTTTQNFDSVLRDMTKAIRMDDPPIAKLYTWRTHERVNNFDQLFGEFNSHDVFIACGGEPLFRNPPETPEDILDRLPDQRIVSEEIENSRQFRAIPPRKIRRYELPMEIDDDYRPQGYAAPTKASPAGPRSRIPAPAFGAEYERGRMFRKDTFSKGVGKSQISPRFAVDENGRKIPLLRKDTYVTSGSEDELDDRDMILPPQRRPEMRRSSEEIYEPPGKKSQFLIIPEEDDEFMASKSDDERFRRKPKFNMMAAKKGILKRLSDAPGGSDPTLNETIDKRTMGKGPMAKKSKQDPMSLLKQGLPDGILYTIEGRKRNNLEPVKMKIHGQRRKFYPPSTFDLDNPSPDAKPDMKLRPEWVYGYRGYDTTQTLHLLPQSEELIYFVGSIIVLFDREVLTQRHYTGHNEDVQCMALHPTKNYVASGQCSGKFPTSTPKDVVLSHCAQVHIWETDTLCTHAIIGLQVFQKGIVSLSFSRETEGEWLLVLDEGDNHVLSVWEWAEERVIAQTKEYMVYDAKMLETHPDTVVFASFHYYDDSCIITGGKEHLYFWKIMNNKILRDKKSGIFEEKPQYVTSIEFAHNGDVVCGDSEGNLTIWSRENGNSFTMRHCVSRAHEKSIYSLCMLEDGTLLTGGGVDRRIRAWDSIKSYNSAKLDRMLPESAGGIRAIVPLNKAKSDSTLIIGTTKNNILEGSLHRKFVHLVHGHTQEIFALAVHPQECAFVTAGHDQQVILWAADSHEVIWKVMVDKSCLCASFTPTGSVIALGTTAGRFIVLSSYRGYHLSSVQVVSEQLDSIAYSPDGTMLVVGSHDKSIYLFTVLDEGQVYRRIGVFRGHDNTVTHLDWSANSQYLQSVSANYDLYFWDLASNKREKSEIVLRDQHWHTQSCILGWTVLGMWTSKDKGIDINSVTRSNSMEYTVAADSTGFVSIYRYPTSSLQAKCFETKSCTGNLTCVRFLMDDSFLISTGGKDAAIMQWSLEPRYGRYYRPQGDMIYK